MQLGNALLIDYHGTAIKSDQCCAGLLWAGIDDDRLRGCRSAGGGIDDQDAGSLPGDAELARGRCHVDNLGGGRLRGDA